MEFDRLKAAFAAVVRGLFDRLDYLALYPAKVVQQAVDGSLEVQPEDTRIPPATNVPLRLGLPGVSVKVASGARVLLGFENGDPRRMIASLWDTASVTEMKIDATLIQLNGGTKEVARKSDNVKVGTLSGGNTGGPVTFVYTPANGGPPQALTTVNLNGAMIDDGAPGVKA